MACVIMDYRITRSKVIKTLHETVYTEASDLPRGVLPTKKQVIECMMYLLRPSRAGKLQRSKEDAAQLLSSALKDHWLYCNIYTITKNNIYNKILKLYKTFQTNIHRPDIKKSEHWKVQMEDFNLEMDKLFDIFCENEIARKRQEQEFGIKMTDLEWSFLDDMRNARIGYCEDQVDRSWQKTMERKLKMELALQKKRDKCYTGEMTTKQTSTEESEVPLLEYEGSMDEPEQEFDTTYCENELSKKRRIMTGDTDNYNDIMPGIYRHLRDSPRKLKPAFYRVVDKMISVYHCSLTQAVASVVETGNLMFDRRWKYHNNDPEKIDYDTVPDNKNIRSAGKAILACTLSEIVDLMMNGSDVVITYHDDGSKKQGCGSFNVQGCTIDGKYRAFPTLPIASETRENLANLKITVLSILSVVSNNRYSMKELHEKITFKVTDSVSHNFGVDEIVALELGTDYIPDHLLCHTHPVLMFNRELIHLFSTIELGIGSEKIFSKLLVSTTNSHDSITEQYMHCIVNLFSPELNHKSWNQSSQFSIHIAPNKNLAVGFRKERFNRFVYLCGVILYLDPFIWSFLSKYEHVTNNLACIVRAFEEVEFLKIHLAVGTLIGVHLIEPFLSLTTSSNIDYMKLTIAMKQLYCNLTSTKPEELLDVSKPAFNFVSHKRFDSTLYNQDIITSLKKIIEQNSVRIVKVLSLVLPKLAYGFHRQRADVFGFGTFDPNSSLLVSKKNQNQLLKAPINNLSAERHVGSINYELKIRGAQQLKSASDTVVKAKSIDLIELKPVNEFDKFRNIVKANGQLVSIWKSWRDSQDNLEEKSLTAKELQNQHTDKMRNSDIEYLKSMGGPFTKPEEVDAFVNSEMNNEQKIKRLYIEVRYCRNSSLSLPKSSPIFRLKENHKNLSISNYQTNLKVYLSKISCCANVSWVDFDTVIEELIAN